MTTGPGQCWASKALLARAQLCIYHAYDCHVVSAAGFLQIVHQLVQWNVPLWRDHFICVVLLLPRPWALQQCQQLQQNASCIAHSCTGLGDGVQHLWLLRMQCLSMVTM